MKTIVCLLVLSGLALLSGMAIASLGLTLVAVVLAIGDLLPASPCSGNCNQRRDCDGQCIDKRNTKL